MNHAATIYIVDDDASIRHSLGWLLESAKYRVATFSSAEEFLQHADPDQFGCLILDVRMPGMDGLDLQQQLMAHATALPIIILTGHGDVPMAVRAMTQGAFDFVQKPFNGPQLLEKIKAAVDFARLRLDNKNNQAEQLRRIQTLTRREQQVMYLIVDGKANKVIAFELGVSLRTVEVHRHRVMEKMQVHSVAELTQNYLQIKELDQKKF